MKWIYLLIITMTGFGFASCNGNSGANSSDSTVNNMPGMDSQATSPSDTTYNRGDSAATPGDSAR